MTEIILSNEPLPPPFIFVAEMEGGNDVRVKLLRDLTKPQGIPDEPYKPLTEVLYSELSHKNCEIWECEMCNPIIGKCDGCDQEFRQVEEVKSPVSTCKTCDRRLCVDCDCGHDNWF